MSLRVFRGTATPHASRSTSFAAAAVRSTIPALASPLTRRAALRATAYPHLSAITRSVFTRNTARSVVHSVRPFVAERVVQSGPKRTGLARLVTGAIAAAVAGGGAYYYFNREVFTPPQVSYGGLSATELSLLERELGSDELSRLRELQPDIPRPTLLFHLIAERCRHGEFSLVREHAPIVGKLRSPNGKTLFLTLVEEGWVDGVKELLSVRDYPFQLTDQDGNNALHLAARYGLEEMVQCLAESVNPNARNDEGYTPIHIAALSGKSHLLPILGVRSRTQLRWKNEIGEELPLVALAVMGGDQATIDQAIKMAPGELTQWSTSMGNLLHLLLIYRRSPRCENFQHLLNSYPKQAAELLEGMDDQGRKPLHLAAQLGLSVPLRFLIQDKGVSPNQVSGATGKSAAHFAALAGSPTILFILAQMGADLRYLDFNNNAPIKELDGRDGPVEEKCRTILTTLPSVIAAQKENPPDFVATPPENLVFAGGGAKGFAYVGVLEELERREYLQGVKRTAGTSAGSMTAALIAVGYGSEDLSQILKKDFGDFFDYTGDLAEALSQSAKSKSWFGSISPILGAFWKDPLARDNPIGRIKTLYSECTHMQGICKGDDLREWMEALIRAKTGKEYCTFKELHELSLKYPNKFKDLYVFATRVNQDGHEEVVRFSYEDPETQDAVISDAVRASVSIPIVFEPHRMHYKNKSVRYFNPTDTSVYVDAGMVRNFAIDAFDGHRYQHSNEYGIRYNRKTLGFRFEEETGEPPGLKKDAADLTVADVAKAVASTYFKAEAIIQKSQGVNEGRTIDVPTMGVGTLDFDLSDERRDAIREAARERLGFFFDPTTESSSSGSTRESTS